MEMQAPKSRRLAWGAVLHDIGKVGIPENILIKNGPLNPEEWRR